MYAASSSVYGDQTVMPLVETLPAQPKSPYGLHKYVGELMMKLWNEIHGIETVSLRFLMCMDHTLTLMARMPSS
ncbi:NAD-dependent epimerase/dehydratase family protein [Candidatus Kaiserbacteria bacterium]|nr:MAG: NAD-dependent epimerase/dehydratase family protein [Candidatus Kaiserbacteria bacterium]